MRVLCGKNDNEIVNYTRIYDISIVEVVEIMTIVI